MKPDALVVDIEPEKGAKDEKGGESSDSEDAAADVLSAIKKGDAKSLDLALQRHYETCEGMSDEAPESEEGPASSKRY